jgi:PAS domain S-box-containing protein
MDQLEREGKIGKVGTPCRSWLGVPLRLDKEVIGIIVVQSYDNRDAFSDADRELLEFVASQLAISIKKKQSEEEIQKLFRSLEQSYSSVILTDQEGMIEYVNPYFTHVTGYGQDEILGKNLRVLFPQMMNEVEFTALWEMVKSGKEWKSEVLNRKKNGTPSWELISISPIKNEQNQISDFLVIKDDITEIKELQLQLSHAQKMESIGTLAGGIAHDFNNLLTVINGHAEICLMKLGDKNPSHRDIVSILQAGKKAEKLTKQLLAFSRKQIYEPRIININQVIQSLDQIIRRLIGEDIQIQITLAEAPSKIKADPIQIEQIMLNLIVNARDAINFKTEFASEKKITIETGMVYLDSDYVTEHAGSKEGAHVVLSISDNGIGMTDDIKAKIFEPFFTTKASGKGTGLGLATVYGIVKQNQGSIYVYSEPNTGTTFKIYWPVSGEMISAESVETVGPERYRGKETILLVEDEEGVLNFATMALKEQGYTVHQAPNGKIALDFMSTNTIPVDLLITDLIMPQMGGKELADRLKKTHPGLRVLFTSGYTDNHIVHSGALKKGLRFIQKPYSVQSLTKKVREILDNTQ